MKLFSKKTEIIRKRVLATLLSAMMCVGLAAVLPGAASAAESVTSPEGFVYSIYNGTENEAGYGAGAYVKFYTGSSPNVAIPSKLGGENVVSVRISYNSTVTSLDVSACTALKDLYGEHNQSLTSLNTAGCAALEYLILFNCPKLTGLDVSQNTALRSLVCPSDNLSVIDVSKNINLKTLWCENNNLTTLDVSKNVALTDLNCESNNLTTLDVSKNVALTDLNCESNSLTVLDVSKNTALEDLRCAYNKILMLDMTQNTVLKSLECYFNNLTTLNVLGCASLEYLSCEINKLTALNASGLVALKRLYCQSNSLNTLNVSGCTAMTYLDCSVNRLTALDISNNSKLEDLDCSWNYLKLSDVTGIPSGLTADVYTASKDFFEDEETGEIYEFEGAFLGGFKFSPQKTGSPPIGDFKDVFTTDWYAKYVEWAADNRVVTGYPDSTFRPNNTMTRAEFVQVLYSLAGKPAVTPTTAFTDVKSDDWYVKAVSWAVESGITSGVGGGEFAPGGSVTREQAVAFLYKYAKLKGDNKDYSGVALTFYDKADISDWAIPAVKWSAANKVVGGYPDGTFGPQNTATRAEVVTILYGYIN